MADITIEVSYNRPEGLLEFRWFKGSQSHQRYIVKYNVMKLHADKVRDALQNLVDAARDQKTYEYAKLTRKLAQEGYGLYNALFFGATKPDRDQAEKVKSWITQYLLPQQHRFTFLVSSKIQIPWGLIYDQPDDDLKEEDHDSDDFQHFWCQKYSAVTQYFGIPPLGIDYPWPKAKFNFLLGADESVWDSASVALEPVEMNVLEMLSGFNLRI